MLPSGPNVDKLIATYATHLLTIEHGDKFEGVVASMFDVNLGPTLRVAAKWVEDAINAIRANPGGDYRQADCEEVAAELLRRLGGD